ncbi:MAG: WG repeat-containing protein [Ferruginibacter sp.]
MKSLVILFLIAYSLNTLAQNPSKEIKIIDLYGTGKCAYEIFQIKVQAEITHKEGLYFSPVVDIMNINNFFSIGSLITTKSDSINGKATRTSIYFQVNLKKKKNLSSTACNVNDWDLLKMSIVGNKYQIPPHTIYNFAETYEMCDYLSDKDAMVRKNHKWGVINENGEIHIPLKYDSLAAHALGFRALLNGEWFLIDEKTGERKPTKNYTRISSSFPKVNKTRLAAVEYNGKFGFVNQEYLEIIPAIYDKVNVLAFKVVVGTRNGKMVLVDEYTGKEKTPLKYDEIKFLSNDRLLVLMRNIHTMGIISLDGKELVKPVYDNIMVYNKEAIIYKRNGKYGLMSFDYKEITPPKFDEMDYEFHDGKVKAKLIGKDVFVNEAGSIVP